MPKINSTTSLNSEESEKYKKLYEEEHREKLKYKAELDGLKMRLAQTVANLSNQNSPAESDVASMNSVSPQPVTYLRYLGDKYFGYVLIFLMILS